MMTSQISKLRDSPKTQKSRYLENEALFFLLKKIIHYTLMVAVWQKNSFLTEVTLKEASFKDILKAFHDFKNNQQNCIK